MTSDANISRILDTGSPQYSLVAKVMINFSCADKSARTLSISPGNTGAEHGTGGWDFMLAPYDFTDIVGVSNECTIGLQAGSAGQLQIGKQWIGFAPNSSSGLSVKFNMFIWADAGANAGSYPGFSFTFGANYLYYPGETTSCGIMMNNTDDQYHTGTLNSTSTKSIYLAW